MRRTMRVMFIDCDERQKENKFRLVATETGVAASFLLREDRRDGYGKLVYYNIIADTDEWEKLESACKKDGVYVCLCDDMEIACKLDCTNEYFDWVKDMAKRARDRCARRLAEEREILDFVKSEGSAERLKVILGSFRGYFSDREQSFFQSRIDILEGRQDEIADEMTSDFKSCHCDIGVLIEKSGMDETEFARYFEIPVRVIRGWKESGYCPQYLYVLLEEKINSLEGGEKDA